MSWDDYVKNMQAQGAQQCGIFTKAGAKCAQSAELDITPNEVQALRQAIDGSTDVKLELNHQPCTLISYDKDEGYVQAKTKTTPLQDSKVFYHAEMTKEYMVVCGKTGAGERGACKISHDICTYLKSLGH